MGSPEPEVLGDAPHRLRRSGAAISVRAPCSLSLNLQGDAGPEQTRNLNSAVPRGRRAGYFQRQRLSEREETKVCRRVFKILLSFSVCECRTHCTHPNKRPWPSFSRPHRPTHPHPHPHPLKASRSRASCSLQSAAISAGSMPHSPRGAVASQGYPRAWLGARVRVGVGAGVGVRVTSWGWGWGQGQVRGWPHTSEGGAHRCHHASSSPRGGRAAPARCGPGQAAARAPPGRWRAPGRGDN